MENFLWVEKYRPRTISDCILPSDLKQTFEQFISQGNVPNLLLAGKPGVGKTTVARALLEQLKADYMVINGSMNGNIDTLRVEIKNFASSVSLMGGRKYVILDEADYLNANSTQPALRNFMEEFSRNCGFILTCNYKNRIIEPLQSRCGVIDFKISGKDAPKLAKQFHMRVAKILEMEGVAFDNAVVAQLISKHFPDWRRILNELQRYGVNGKIDAGILSRLDDIGIATLVDDMKAKNYSNVRKWVGENSDVDCNVLFRKFYDEAAAMFKPQSVPQLVLILADYQYKAAFVADPEINLAACMAEIMVQCEFK